MMFKEEIEILDKLAEIWDLFQLLEKSNDWEVIEFMMKIHELQNLIAARHIWRNQDID